MTEDFVTRLRLELREAALREERRPAGMRGALRRPPRRPTLRPMAAALAAILLALAVALGAVALRGEPEPAALRVIGTYRVGAGLDSLAAGFGDVWTADPIRGEVLRIDTATRRVAARIPVGGDARVATGAGAVWAIAGDLQFGGSNGPVRLLRIDPATDRVVARIPMRTPAGARFVPLEVQIDRGAVWAVGLDGALRIDPRRNVPDAYVPLAGGKGDPRGIVAGRSTVWALTAAGRLRTYDARTGRAAGALTSPSPPAVHLFGGPPNRLTVLLAKNQLALLERGSGRMLWRATVGEDVGGLLFDRGRLWVVSADPMRPGATDTDRLVGLDAATGRRVDDVRLPEPGVTGMAKVGGEVWLAMSGGRMVAVAER
jgi:PQQ-like domain